MVPFVISTNTTLGTMDDISVSSELEWFSSLTKHSFVEWPLFQFPSLTHPCPPAVVHHMWNTAHSSTQSRGQCWGMCSCWYRSSSLALSPAVLGQGPCCLHGDNASPWAPSLRACSSLQHQQHSLSWALPAWEAQKGHPYTKQWCSVLSITMLENLLERGINCS